MSMEIDILPLDDKLIKIQDEVRIFFDWDLKSDIESANQLLATVENTSIDSWTRPQRSVTVANLRRRLVLRETSGWYEVPKKTSIRDLAVKLGLSKSTVAEQLVKAEGEIVKQFLKKSK